MKTAGFIVSPSACPKHKILARQIALWYRHHRMRCRTGVLRNAELSPPVFIQTRAAASGAPYATVRLIMASRSVNKVILVGNLGRDAETKFTPSGASVTKFAVATSRSWKDPQSNEWKEETNWTNVVLWRQENLANYLTKGTKVYVEGRLQTRNYDDKDGKKVYTTEVVAEEVILLGGRGEGTGGGFETGAPVGARAAGGSAAPRGRTAAPSPAAEDDQFRGMDLTDDDVPF